MFLIADDDRSMRQLMVAMLNEIGVSDVKEAASGVEALFLVDQHPQQIEVMILDLCMPQMDGIELLRELAERNFSGRLVVISGLDKSVLRGALEVARMHPLNVIGALPKPIDLTELTKLLQRTASLVGKVEESFRHLQLDDLFDAVMHRQIEPYYQPLVDIRNEKIVGIEALARWEHATLGMIPPDVFIPMAEREGVIYTLTNLMFELALIDFQKLKQLGYPLHLSFNLSATLLSLHKLPDNLFKQLQKHDIDPGDIILEITESFGIVNDHEAMETLSRLRLKGFKLAIDDFGTGYAAINNLLNMPFTQIKIDRSFVTDASNNEVAKTLLESCLRLSHDLELDVVCEGIESEEDLNLVKRFEGTIAQGFLISRPKPFKELVRWLESFDSIVKGGASK
jgi:EAL domain-containing protein (putative c-di-GMP-specific phosphodiesterase class I)/ActR/RegA family two-component response regulator